MKRFLFLPICLVFTLIGNAQTTTPDVVVNVRLTEAVTKAQVISLSTIGVNARGQGQRVMELVLQNRSNTTANNLYLHVSVSASSVGLVATIDTKQNDPFSLRPMQLVVADNNRLLHGIPGIVGGDGFEGGLTTEGEDFVESLAGATRLPDAIYTVVVSLYHGNNRLNGGRLVSTVTQSIGSRPIMNITDFNLLTPGGPLGSNELSASSQPSFRWEGPSNTDYRLIIVQDPGRGQSAESLIQAALSTEPVIGRSPVGSLLENEMIDAIIRNNTFFYPTSGVKRLAFGRKYYWQVIAQIRTSRGVDSRPSSIYEFTLSNPQTAQNAELQAALLPMASSISPEVAAAIQQLIQSGYAMDKLVIDGRELSGATLQAFLEDFVEKVKRGEIILVK